MIKKLEIVEDRREKVSVTQISNSKRIICNEMSYIHLISHAVNKIYTYSY